MNLSDSKKKLALAGVLCGLVAACLAYFGNPANMAFCIACFIRDTAGALGFHQAEVVQYARPEIIGLVIGAFIISVATKEYRSTAGSSPMIRFILGMVIMIGSLIFLGCPLRMVIRMSAGDLNAWVVLYLELEPEHLHSKMVSALDVRMRQTKKVEQCFRY